MFNFNIITPLEIFLMNNGFKLNSSCNISYIFNLIEKEKQYRTIKITFDKINDKVEVNLDKQYLFSDDVSEKTLLNTFNSEFEFDRNWLLETIQKLK